MKRLALLALMIGTASAEVIIHPTGDQGQLHTWTGVDDRPNSSAGTEGYQRSLFEWIDVFTRNEWLSPVSKDQPEIPWYGLLRHPQLGCVQWLGCDETPTPTPVPEPEPIPEPATSWCMVIACVMYAAYVVCGGDSLL